ATPYCCSSCSGLIACASPLQADRKGALSARLIAMTDEETTRRISHSLLRAARIARRSGLSHVNQEESCHLTTGCLSRKQSRYSARRHGSRRKSSVQRRF